MTFPLLPRETFVSVKAISLVQQVSSSLKMKTSLLFLINRWTSLELVGDCSSIETQRCVPHWKTFHWKWRFWIVMNRTSLSNGTLDEQRVATLCCRYAQQSKFKRRNRSWKKREMNEHYPFRADSCDSRCRWNSGHSSNPIVELSFQTEMSCDHHQRRNRDFSHWWRHCHNREIDL